MKPKTITAKIVVSESRPTDQRLKRAAIKWWEARRPLAFDLSQHLDNPAVNCLDGHDSELAIAVAATIKASKKKAK